MAKRRTVVWTARARHDLMEIASYISRDKVEAASAWVDRLERVALEIPRHPHRHRVVPEFDNKSIREALVGNYRLVYRVEAARISVLTVFEGHRSLSLPNDETSGESSS